jgi:hypothetical protein
MSLILSGTDGLSDVDGSAATPAIRGTDANTGIFFPAADTIAFAEGGTEVMRITSAGGISFGATGTAYGTSGQVLTSAGNASPTWTTITAGTIPAFSAYASAATSAANATLTKLLFATEEFDTNNNFSSSTFTPTVAGYYQINGCVNGGYSTLLVTIYKNGTEYKRGMQANGTTLTQAIVSSIVYCNGSTDYIDLYAYQGSGSTQNFGTGSTATYFNGCLVRAA